MLIINLLVLSVCVATVLLSIHNQDEIHQLVAFLSGLIALICVLILSPPLIKGVLGLLFLSFAHRIFPTSQSFK